MTSPGAADNKIKSGILDCDVSAGVGLIFTEKQTMNCKFTPLGSGPVDHYTGSIDEVGLSIGATEGGVLVWSVISAQQGGVPAGALAGKYTGLSADASVGARIFSLAAITAHSRCSRRRMKGRSASKSRPGSRPLR
jgi:Protein of unknown function (DUF992)